MSKQFFTKVSILIDKLSYINSNNDFNSLNKDNLDFNLLKSYSKELYELLNSTVIEEKRQINSDNINEVEENVVKEPPIKPVTVQKPPKIRQGGEITNNTDVDLPEDELHMKPISDNIFDTVNSIKQKSKISRLNRLQINENLIANEPKEVAIEREEIKITSQPKETPFKQLENKTEPIIEKEEASSVNNEIVKEAAAKPSFIKEVTTKEQEETEENLSLNDRFKQPTTSVADKAAKTDYKNLKELIDINDRFLFIQKLFGGSYLAFEESVNQINSINTYSEALDYIDYKIKSNFNWDSDTDEVAKFLSILEKKYN